MSAFSSFDRECMAQALQLARRGWYSSHPNPRVGCIIANRGVVVGRGFHRRAGETHAEVNALADAGDRARGGTAYVTLEPCNHVGRTGPCTAALVDAGIEDVVFACADPHAAAAGGSDALRAAGIAVRGPLMEQEARQINAGFIKRCTTGRPFVTIKLAMSLDGRTAMANGESQWITGPGARADVQKLRAQSGAVITGLGTVLADNPAMTVRSSQLQLENAEEIAARQPLRVIVDSGLRTPVDAALVKIADPVMIATCEEVTAQAAGFPGNVETVCLRGSDGKVDLDGLLAELAARECNDVLVEAGAGLCGAFVERRLADTIVIYVAGKFLGSNARPLLSLPLETMSQAVRLNIEDIRAVGSDWRITVSPVTEVE